jgi:hypothetical protein
MSSRRAGAAVWFTLALGGCADWTRGEAADDAGVPAAGTADGGQTFAAAVHAVLMDGCRTCHGPSGEASHTAFVLTGAAPDDYVTTVAFVDVRAPASSRLLIKMSGAGHGGGAVFASGSPEFAVVLRWIREGALP